MVSLLDYYSEYTEQLVDRIRTFIEAYDPSLVYVMYSGGKDSTAALVLFSKYVENTGFNKFIIIYNEIVGNTHPLNMRQAYNVVSKLFDSLTYYVVDNPLILRNVVYRAKSRGYMPAFIHVRSHSSEGLDFKQFIQKYNKFRRVRLCHKEFKDRYWRQLPGFAGKRYFIVGVKASDSGSRKSRWKSPVTVFKTNSYTDYALSPIYDLSSTAVWQIIKNHGIRLETYDLCGDSLNCVFCPFRGKAKQERINKCLGVIGW